jgi:hypothetical protein
MRAPGSDSMRASAFGKAHEDAVRSSVGACPRWWRAHGMPCCVVERSRSVMVSLVFTILTLANCIPAMGDSAAASAIEQPALVRTSGEPTEQGGMLWTFVMETGSPGACLDVHAAEYGGSLKIDNFSPQYPCRPGGFWGGEEMAARAGAQRCAPAFEAVLRALRWRAEYRSTAAMGELFAGTEVWLPFLGAPELVLASSSRCTASSGLVRFRFAHTGRVPARW